MAEEIENNEQVENPDGAENLKVLENIDVNLTVEVGRTEITIRDLLRLNEGSVVELDRLAGDPLDIMVNNTKIAKGEVVMVGERLECVLVKLLIQKNEWKAFNKKLCSKF